MHEHLVDPVVREIDEHTPQPVLSVEHEQRVVREIGAVMDPFDYNELLEHSSNPDGEPGIDVGHWGLTLSMMKGCFMFL